MRDEIVRALLLLEARRGLAMLRRVAPGLAAICGIFVLIRGGDTLGWGMAMGVVAVGQGMYPGVRVLQDKLDGSLEFLVSLPVDARTLARTHVLACLGWALLLTPLGAAASILISEDWRTLARNPQAVALALSGFLAVATVLSSVGAGLALRLRAEAMGWVFTGSLLSLMVLPDLVERVWPGTGDRFVAWLLAGPPMWVVPTFCVALLCGGLALALVLLEQGYARFEPPPGGLPGTPP